MVQRAAKSAEMPEAHATTTPHPEPARMHRSSALMAAAEERAIASWQLQVGNYTEKPHCGWKISGTSGEQANMIGISLACSVLVCQVTPDACASVKTRFMAEETVFRRGLCSESQQLPLLHRPICRHRLRSRPQHIMTWL